jgi:hypothetical protein
MTRKEMITKCVEEQIKSGLIRAESKPLQIKVRLNGGYGMKAMSLEECKKWYNVVFN